MILGLVAFAHASELQPLFSGVGTPWTIGARNGAIGLFRPFAFGLGEKTELESSGRWSLLAPHLGVKRTLLTTDGGFAFSATFEVGVPTFGLRLLQTSFLQPINAEQEIPWAVVPGLDLMGGWRNDHLVLSVGVRARFGIPFGENELTPQDLAWLDPMIAPLSYGWSLQPHLRVDWLPTPAWVLTAAGKVEIAGGPDFEGKLFVLRGIGDYLAAGVGVAGAMDKYRDGYPDKPVAFLNVVPLFDVQTRW